jgi:hypothetical protein
MKNGQLESSLQALAAKEDEGAVANCNMQLVSQFVATQVAKNVATQVEPGSTLCDAPATKIVRNSTFNSISRFLTAAGDVNMFYVHGFVFGKFHLLIFIISLQKYRFCFTTQECDFYAVAKVATVKRMLWGYVHFVCLC